MPFKSVRGHVPPSRLDDAAIELLVGAEWADWYRLTPLERWSESERLREAFLDLGGNLGVPPDSHSPFFDADTWREVHADGWPGVRSLRRRGV